MFIKDAEELCFVEESGRAKIYNLISGQFRAGVSQLPPNSSKVLSTPDGACIVAFVKERQQSSESSQIEPKEIVKAYIYFCSEFGKQASKG